MYLFFLCQDPIQDPALHLVIRLLRLLCTVTFLLTFVFDDLDSFGNTAQVFENTTHVLGRMYDGPLLFSLKKKKKRAKTVSRSPERFFTRVFICHQTRGPAPRPTGSVSFSTGGKSSSQSPDFTSASTGLKNSNAWCLPTSDPPA